MDFPRDSEKGKRHGLLTYTMVKILTEAETKLMVQRIHADYIASQGRLGPTPLVEGVDRHKEVLGVKEFPQRSRLVLRPTGRDTFALNAGSLHGLTKGSILAVFAPAGEKGNETRLGHIRITRTKLVESTAEPCKFDGMQPKKSLPNGSRCQLVQLDYGDLQLKVAFDAAAAKDIDLEMKKWKQLLKDVGEAGKTPFRIVEKVEEADWLIRPNGEEKLVLVPSEGWTEAPESDAPQFGPVRWDEEVAVWLKDRLGRIARARNLLQISGTAQAQTSRGWLSGLFPKKPINIKLQLFRLEDSKDTKGRPVAWKKGGISLEEGELIAIRVENIGRYTTDFSLLFIDSSFGIAPVFPPGDTVVDNRLEPGQSYTVGPLQVEGNTFGLEHVVAVAVRAEGQPLDFSWLAQDSIERARTRSSQRGAGDLSFENPVGRLLQKAVFANGSTRGLKVVDAAGAAMRTVSWKVTKRNSQAESSK